MQQLDSCNPKFRCHPGYEVQNWIAICLYRCGLLAYSFFFSGNVVSEGVQATVLRMGNSRIKFIPYHVLFSFWAGMPASIVPSNTIKY